MRIQVSLALLVVGALAGCSSAPLSQLRETTPTGSEVSRALADEYERFAAVEVTEMLDLKDGEYFVGKGLQAARGNEPVPEKVADWGVSGDTAAYLRTARNRLAAALANRHEDAAPRSAAAAQVGFDCWLEQQEEGYQRADIETCRRTFAASVGDLESRKDHPHSVFFDHDAADLKPEAERRIRQLAARALRLDVPRITVLGHADSTGADRHNLALSLKRADNVEDALIRAGVASERIGVAAAGETRLRVPTGDGIAEPQNRRVEVLFQPATGW